MPVPIFVMFLFLYFQSILRLTMTIPSLTTTKGAIPKSSIAPISGLASTAIALETTKDVKVASKIFNMRTSNKATLIYQ